MTDEDMDFTVWGIIDKPVQAVFDAVADPAQLSAHFTTGGASGIMQAGETMMWEFADFPGAFPVRILRVEPPGLIRFDWPRNDGKGNNHVTFQFQPVGDDRCKVSVTESGWSPTAGGLQMAYDNCMGWSMMLAAMKAWLDHGIVLRQGMFR